MNSTQKSAVRAYQPFASGTRVVVAVNGQSVTGSVIFSTAYKVEVNVSGMLVIRPRSEVRKAR